MQPSHNAAVTGTDESLHSSMPQSQPVSSFMSNSAPSLQPLCLRHDVGDVIQNRYAVRQVLGAGAFGTVYRVEETIGARLLTLACKEMHVLDDPQTARPERAEALRLFQEEAYVLQTLRHPHIPAAHFEPVAGVWLACPVCGRTFRGVRQCPDHGSALQVIKERYYLIMDFIEGPDLEQMIEANGGQSLDEVRVIDWALQVCDALEVVHKTGLSHRDIKPANIKIQQATGQAMLIDFGLVKPSTIAGGYGTVLQSAGAGVGTLGYAPSSPQEQAHPDARTDILALGMTLYRLLTGRDPTDPQDLETMRHRRPRELNAVLTPALDEIIIKATQVEAERRYADVAALRKDLQAARYPLEVTCPHCGLVQRLAQRPDEKATCTRCGRLLAAAGKAQPQPSSSGPSQPSTARPNPYEPRLQQIRAELAQATAPPSTFDARIREIESRIALAGRGAAGTATDQCPACHKARLAHIAGEPTNLCPLCHGAQLLERHLDGDLCPVCRDGALKARHLSPNLIFCPLCREVPVRPEERSVRFGLMVDLWWACPHCQATWDVLNKGRATLMEYTQDPFGTGASHKGETLSVEQWRQLSARTDRYYACDNCTAQFDALDHDGLRLMHCPADPHGVGGRFKGATFSRPAWARIARDLPVDAGTHHCPHCKAEFDVDGDRRTMTLLQMGASQPDWAESWQKTPMSFQDWFFAAAGKRSLHPGWLCPACKTEFDQDDARLRLVWTPLGSLSPYVNRSCSWSDWQRIAAGAPTVEEERKLRDELAHWQREKQKEQAELQRAQLRRRAPLERELTQLYKQSVLEGFIPFKRLTAASGKWARSAENFVALPWSLLHSPLRSGETLRWESPASELGMGAMLGALLGTSSAQGLLSVTSERILFASQPHKVWERPLQQLHAAAAQSLEGFTVLSLEFHNSRVPILFAVGPVTWNVIVAGEAREIFATPQDLESLLRTLVRI
jgi:eukaryotic-like serine/threonine-protein kinase